ncbi:MAG: cobalamin B12-binding domain-containing protein [Desulfovermiculus sp.]
MSNQELFGKLTQALVDLNEDDVLAFSKQGLEEHMDPQQLIEQGLLPGMQQVGDEFENEEKFLPEMMQAANIFQSAMDIIQPKIEEMGGASQKIGTVVLGTVKGDMHYIGKNIFKVLLETSGFTVHDLGVDVDPFSFIDKAEQTNADIIAMSALLTTTLVGQRDMIEALNEQGKRDKYKIMVGGGAVTPNWVKEIQADGYSETAFGAVKEAKKLVQ